MLKAKIFVGELLLEEVFNNCEIESFFMAFDDFHNTLLQEKGHLPVKVYINLESLMLYNDFDLYSVKTIIGNILDGKKYVEVLNSKIKWEHSLYQISPNNPDPFEEIKCSVTNEAFENSISSPDTTKLLSRVNSTKSYLRINKVKADDLPLIVSMETITIDVSFIKIFLDSYVKDTFADNKEYLKFCTTYLAFYTSFNWNSWSPLSNPAPAHNVIACIKKNHTSIKDDSYLIKWGYIMAVLNGGKFNKLLTQLNEPDKRVNDVFQLGFNKGSETIFYTIDTENGLLEMYNYKGIHCNQVYGLSKGLVEQKRKYTIKVPRREWL